MQYNLETYILLFFIYSILGWIMEVFRMIINPKIRKFINRGFLIGPYLPIYGCGVVAITILLSKYENDIPALLCLSLITCGILEYGTSYIMEKLFNARWWDYSKRKFNINGRICLETLIPFGIAGTIVICFSNPIFIHLIELLPDIIVHIICGSLTFIFLIDFIISFTVISKLKNTANEIDLSEDDDTENISNFVKDKTEDIAMQLESDIRKNIRKRKLKRKRTFIHTKLKTTKTLKSVKLESKTKRENLTKDINNKISNIKTSSEDFTSKIKKKFSEKSFLNKRLINAFPDIEILEIKNKIKEKLNKK